MMKRFADWLSRNEGEKTLLKRGRDIIRSNVSRWSGDISTSFSLERCRDIIRSNVPNAEMVLYGSRARRDAMPDEP